MGPLAGTVQVGLKSHMSITMDAGRVFACRTFSPVPVPDISHDYGRSRPTRSSTVQTAQPELQVEGSWFELATDGMQL